MSRLTERGIALITVLMMTSLLLIMVLSLYVSSRGGLFGSVIHQRQIACLNVAEAGVADTMDALEASNFALTTGPLSGTLAGVGGNWQVNFKDTAPFLPLDSVNNLNGAAAAESYRGVGTVPPRSALIVVQARVGDVERVLEVVVARSSTGVNTANAIQVGGTLSMSGDVQVDGMRAFDDTTAVPGNVHSNGAVGLVVGWDGTGTARVTGKVSSVAPGGGAIDLNGYLPEGGPLAPGAAAAPFPSVDIPALVSAKSSSPVPVIPGVGAASLASGDFYLNGPVTINGDLNLADSHLYVNGALTVNGSITGSGSVHATGATSLQGASNITAGPSGQVALFSGGDVSLTGFNGSQYLDALAVADPAAANYFSNAKLTFADMISQLDNPALNLYADSDVDRMRRTLGHNTAVAWTYAGRPADCLGQLALRIEANQPLPSPTRDFLLKKLDDLSGAYNQGQPYGDNGMGLFANIQGGPDTPVSVAADHRAFGRTNALVDAINDSSAVDLAPSLQKRLDWASFNGLGSSYFQGLVYSDGNILAQNEVSVVGALMARGNLVLSSGTRVTFVQDLFDDPASVGPMGGLVVQSWIGR